MTSSLPDRNPHPVIQATSDGQVTYANPAADERFPGLEDAGADHPILDGLAAAARTLATGQEDEVVRQVTIEGRTYEQRITALADSDRLHLYILDVTERERALRALERSEARYRDLYENAPLAYFTVGTDGRIEHANHEAYELLGYEEGALVGRPVTELYADGPSGAQRAEEIFGAAVEGEVVAGEELRMVGEDGTPLWGSLTVQPVRDEAGQVIESRAQVLDITDRRRAEERVEALLDAAPDALLVVDAAGKIGLVNQQAVTLFGYDRDELVGRAVEDLVPKRVRQDHVEHRRGYMEDPQRRPMGVGLDLEAVRKDGSAFPVEISLSPIETDEGTQVIAAVRDMSQREQERERLREYAEQLERSNAELEQFAYVISHDLKEPIRMITSYLGLLEDRYKGELDDDADDFIEFAVDGARRMHELIESLLAYSRVERKGKDPAPVDATEVLDGVLNALQVQIEERDAQVTHDEMPEVLADKAQLSQVLQNLISNAIKFVPDDRQPKVHIAVERTDGYWRFSVEDNGPGIAEDQRDRIFMIFQRLHTSEEVEGQGIGLAISKKIVERHGGEIWVESEEGEGSTFHFTMEASDGADNEGQNMNGPDA